MIRDLLQEKNKWSLSRLLLVWLITISSFFWIQGNNLPEGLSTMMTSLLVYALASKSKLMENNEIT